MPQPTSTLTPARLAAYGCASSAAAAGVVVRAFRERSNFYAAAVWLGRSNGCMLVLMNFGLFLTLVFGKAVQRIFFGRLRAVEVEHLYERSWYAVTSSLLAMTVFREQFDASFVVLFGTLLFLKVFHWLSADRVEYMEQSPSVSRLFHIRMCAMLWTLLLLDGFLVAFALEVLLLDGKQMGIMIMFASEFMILTATLLSTIAKYIINVQDMRSEVPWEAKSMHVFYVDLVTDFLKLATYLSFFALILTYFGLPFNIVGDVYATGRSFFGRVRDLIRYRAATRNMNSRYPDATAEDMRSLGDGTCIICREDMVVRGPGQQAPSQGPNETPKKLPCGHIFHFYCLRSWLERQQSCPTCRRTVLGTDQPAGTTRPANGAAAPAPGAGLANNAAPQGPTPTPTTSANAAANAGPAGDAGAAAPPGQTATARDRLQGFLQQLRSDAQRARQQGDATAREAGRAAQNGASTPNTASHGGPNRAGASSPIPRTLINAVMERGSGGQYGAGAGSAGPGWQQSYWEAPSAYGGRAGGGGAGEGYGAYGAYGPGWAGAPGTGGPWAPPPPWALRPPQYPSRSSSRQRNANGQPGSSSGSREAAGGSASTAARSTACQEDQSSTETDGPPAATATAQVNEKEGEESTSTDPVDAREAARAAALRRFQKASGSGSVPVTQAGSNDALPSAPSSSTANQEQPAHQQQAQFRPDGPRLIPLFNPALVPGFPQAYTPHLPFPLAGPVHGLSDGLGNPNASWNASANMQTTQEMDVLSEAQLVTLASASREGIQERLRVLGQVQSTVWRVVEELTRVLSVLPAEEASASLNSAAASASAPAPAAQGPDSENVREEQDHENRGKGKAPAEGIHAPSSSPSPSTSPSQSQPRFRTQHDDDESRAQSVSDSAPVAPTERRSDGDDSLPRAPSSASERPGDG